MKCGCVAKVNEQLKPWGLELKTTIAMIETDGTNSLITTLSLPLQRIDSGRFKKDDPQTIQCAYCPFCGEKIDLKKEAEELCEEAGRKKTEAVNG